MRIIILGLFISLAVSLPSVTYSQTSFPDRYDAEIKEAAKHYLPGVDWRLYKAQLYQESRLDPLAVSPVGARGLGQFMPGTWADMQRAMRLGVVSPHETAPAIEAGAFYMARLRTTWYSPRPDIDRHMLALASYNAGAGHIINAQRRCGGARLYKDIIKCLPDVTGRHAEETQTYVKRIWQWWALMSIGM